MIAQTINYTKQARTIGREIQTSLENVYRKNFYSRQTNDNEVFSIYEVHRTFLGIPSSHIFSLCCDIEGKIDVFINSSRYSEELENIIQDMKKTKNMKMDITKIPEVKKELSEAA